MRVEGFEAERYSFNAPLLLCRPSTRSLRQGPDSARCEHQRWRDVHDIDSWRSHEVAKCSIWRGGSATSCLSGNDFARKVEKWGTYRNAIVGERIRLRAFPDQLQRPREDWPYGGRTTEINSVVYTYPNARLTIVVLINIAAASPLQRNGISAPRRTASLVKGPKPSFSRPGRLRRDAERRNAR